MPAASTVIDWAQGRNAEASAAGFPEQYARAREVGYLLLADEIIEIADDTSHDTKTVGEGDHEREVADAEWISRSRLRVDSRKWLLSKMLPKVYGDKVDHNLSGEIGLKRIERVILKPPPSE
jgi:hypothetical protein